MFFSARICFSAQICFSVHEYIFQCTNLFFSAQICFSVHKYIFHCTNIFPVHKYMFFSAQIYFTLHKYVTGYDGGQVTIVFLRLTGCHFASQRASQPDLKGFLVPYWKACFVPSVEIKCKLPLHFAPAVAGA